MISCIKPHFLSFFTGIGIFLILLSGDALGQNPKSRLFNELSPKKLKINFKNTLKEDAQNNILRYEYFYNGAGVAVGDLDNDGLEDLFFTANMSQNKVYKNLGDWRFEDRTKTAGVAGKNSWTTGVSMADVNGDGWLDIYVSFSGKGDEESRRNELWINQKDFTFINEAKTYGLDDPSNSTQGLFFDFDRDGDLDLFLLNHHIQVITEIEFDQARAIRHPYAGDKLYRNDGGKFIDISESAGIKGNALGFGLGVVSADVNEDGFPDLLVTNDYIEPDYLYINQQNGTFKDLTADYFQHISHFSMGADISDVNNDGLMDIYTLDMLPEDNERQKLLYGPENYEQYSLMIERGFYHQNMRNMLQLNQGGGLFSEIGQMANISNTDWSWSALFFDANNDGNKDLMITNGYFRDYTNRDFLKYKGDYYFKQAVAKEKADTLHLVTSMASTPVHNYIFENQADLTFADRTEDWGFNAPGFSSGAVYSDLDNDGDLDLVISNLNDAPSIYENQSMGQNYLNIRLKATGSNSFGVGAKVELRTENSLQKVENQPVRGFQSSVSPILHFGLGSVNEISELMITWPDGTTQSLNGVKANQLLEIEQESNILANEENTSSPLLSEIKGPEFTSGIVGFNDFKRQPLMVTMPSYIAPVMASADLNGDGHLEVFFGGTKGQAAEIKTYIDGVWKPYPGFRSEENYTDAVAIFGDVNGDGIDDLFLGSGGFHDYLSSDDWLSDRLYLNDGKGKLIKSALPDYKFATGTAQFVDINRDGHLDIFVGARLLPGRYPEVPKSVILLNDSKGSFHLGEESLLPNLGKLGLITSSTLLDLNSDGIQDLVLAGEFTPLTFLINKEKGFEDQTSNYLETNLSGWWGSLASADFDGDGDLDLIAGNFGLNSQFEASEEKILRLYSADFDQNGSIDPILECFVGDGAYPFPSRDELLDQMVSMRSKFTDYASYSKATMNDLFSSEQLEKAQVLEANTLNSYYLENENGRFVPKKLPMLAQSFPVYSILPVDLNQDGNMDLILGGNQNFNRIRIGMIDSSFGLVLLGDGKGEFTPLGPNESGLAIQGDIKSILKLNREPIIVFGINQQSAKAYKINE